MTKKLFWEDPYQTECEAKVVEIEGKKVRLDKTIFYAFSGGQASDKGKIGGIEVKEAIKEGKEIYYILETEPNFKVGDNVKVEIDWNRRYKIMRLHSATHIVYHFLSRKLGIKKLIGSNISENKGRIDFEYPEAVTKYIEELEREVNNFISKPTKIETFFTDEKNERRMWVCGEVKMPCGGTHVKSTDEIGKVKLKRKNIGRGKERIEIRVE